MVVTGGEKNRHGYLHRMFELHIQLSPQHIYWSRQSRLRNYCLCIDFVLQALANDLIDVGPGL